jgi:hypothetical protein
MTYNEIVARLATTAADRRIVAAIAGIEALGYSIRYVEWCEDAHTPGLLGQIRGVTDHRHHEVKISTKANPGPETLADALEHELRHVIDPEWDCGNRDVLGRGAPR